jgi:outer membrane protein assembly factor BamB
LLLSGCAAGSPVAQNAFGLEPNVAENAYAADDWTTFAHDDKRSGFQSSAGITAANVKSLRLKWKSSVKDAVIASPLVWDGNVVIVTLGLAKLGATVYDFRAQDGKLLWKTVLGGKAVQTPVIDPANGKLFVGNELSSPLGLAAPSFFFAIDMLTGRMLWRHRTDGIAHAAAIAVGGTVYTGSAGGDAPGCLNGGVTAFDEATGAVRWDWHVNPKVTPYGGGGVWGALAYDGTHLIFGTGNTCQSPVTTADGAVALKLDGKVAWTFVAVKQSLEDSDTGGGVLVSAHHASFINKNGTFYSLLASTGREAWTSTLNNSYGGVGGFATPSTDGSTIVVGAGTFASSEDAAMLPDRVICAIEPRGYPKEAFVGHVARVVAMNQSGTVLWSRSMQSRLVGYVAIVPGLAFAGLDQNLVALDLRTGRELWKYAAPADFGASPAIVPSGVYEADSAGNVYRFMRR